MIFEVLGVLCVFRRLTGLPQGIKYDKEHQG
jgi:hypothetical protein